MDINDILHKRGQVVAQMKAVLAHAESENRDLTGEESAKYDAMDSDQNGLKARADRIQNAAKVEAELGQRQTTGHRAAVDTMSRKESLEQDAYKSGFNAYARVGKAGLSHDILNALQVGTDSEGGYIVPTEFDTMLVEALQDINEIRSLVTVISTGSDRNIPVESSLGTAAWTAEEAAYTESDAAFGQVILSSYKLGTIIKVSEELLEDSFFNVEAYLARNFGKRFGIAEEAAFVAGAGSTRPTGIVQGSGLGVTAAGVAAITADEVIDLYHSLGRPYRSNATFMMADATVKLVRKLKDSNGVYLWQPGLQAGQPDQILGQRLVTSVAMPAATTGLKSVVFGDLSCYTVADRTGSVMQRLNELYAAGGQVGFRMRKRMDGKVTDAAGIKHLIQA